MNVGNGGGLFSSGDVNQPPGRVVVASQPQALTRTHGEFREAGDPQHIVVADSDEDLWVGSSVGADRRPVDPLGSVYPGGDGKKRIRPAPSDRAAPACRDAQILLAGVFEAGFEEGFQRFAWSQATM